MPYQSGLYTIKVLELIRVVTEGPQRTLGLREFDILAKIATGPPPVGTDDPLLVTYEQLVAATAARYFDPEFADYMPEPYPLEVNALSGRIFYQAGQYGIVSADTWTGEIRLAKLSTPLDPTRPVDAALAVILNDLGDGEPDHPRPTDVPDPRSALSWWRKALPSKDKDLFEELYCRYHPDWEQWRQHMQALGPQPFVLEADPQPAQAVPGRHAYQ